MRRDGPGTVSVVQPSVVHHMLIDTATERPARPLAEVVALDVMQGAAGQDGGVGYIDYFGYLPSCQAWLLVGWSGADRLRRRNAGEAVTIYFEGGRARGRAMCAFFSRPDIAGQGEGVVLLVRSAQRATGRLLSVEIDGGDGPQHFYASETIQHLRDGELTARTRSILQDAWADEGRQGILNALNRGAYAGVDTVDALTDVFLALDEVIDCPPDGVVLIGWLLAKPGALEEVRLVCDNLSTPVDFATCIRVERRDVTEAVGAAHGITDAQCGFVAYLPHSVIDGETAYLEVATTGGQVGFLRLPPARLRGTEAMRRVLGCFTLRYEQLAGAYDRVIGPAIQSINAARLAQRPRVRSIGFGADDIVPRASVIVPLYGRIDFMEYQLALLSGTGAPPDVEYIFVLDDPGRTEQTVALAESAAERFGIPFRLLLLEHNVGYAPANNIGLAHARGEFVCFLNSDVFTEDPHWIERLIARLEADSSIGLIGPLLTFEDDTIQHDGMNYEMKRDFANWLFPFHDNKGWRPSGVGVHRPIAITGACMVLRRSLAEQLGGFDEVYAIGDFEDSDLCLRARALGLDSAVDRDVRMYHLERKSQEGAGHSWRMNLTLYNAWVHQRRWGEALAAAHGLRPVGMPREKETV